MKTRYKIAGMVFGIVAIVMVVMNAGTTCIFVGEGSPKNWLGSIDGCGPLLTYEIQKFFGVFWSIIPNAYADCIVNDDWPEAPCLDQIINGKYNQDEVNKWSKYYSYKGSAFMELKYLALNEAIKQNRLEEWIDDSVINQNVYQYYFFSARAPNIGQIHGDFDIITVNEETFTEEILILVENKMRKVYYTGENIISVLAYPISASVIFETGENAKLDVKAPRVYKIGPGLFILRNGEEVDAVTDSDECFFYVTIETKEPEKIEIGFAAWPEYMELVENCETFTVAPLKQIQLGVLPDDIQCHDDKVLVFKSSDDSPACVKPETKTKLIERGWAIEKRFHGLTKPQIEDVRLAELGCKKTGNQTYCDLMIQEKITFYEQQNQKDSELEPDDD